MLIKYTYDEFFSRVRDVLKVHCSDGEGSWCTQATLQYAGMRYVPEYLHGMWFEVVDLKKHQMFTLRHGLTDFMTSTVETAPVHCYNEI